MMLVTKEPLPAGPLLDYGCGEGSFSVRLASSGRQVVGVDLSPTAVAAAKGKLNAGCNAQVEFRVLDLLAGDSPLVASGGEKFAGIICSQVAMYYKPTEYQLIIRRLAEALAPGGRLYLANNIHTSQLSSDEVEGLVAGELTVLESGPFEHHHVLVATNLQHSMCVTIDYEGWEYPPESGRNRSPDFDKEVVLPTNSLMSTAERYGCRLTLFVEVAQIAFWEQVNPTLVAGVKDQIREAVRRGHDVQLHLHPRWLTRFGARYDAARDMVIWANDKLSLAQLTDQELADVLRWAHEYLREIVVVVDPTYRPRVFRAGKYQIQPHARVFRTLQALGYEADTSAWQGGYLREYEGAPGYDFRHLWTTNEAYVPHDDDINVPSEERSEHALLEIPIYSKEGRQLNLDALSATEARALVERSSGKAVVAIGHSKLMATNLSNLEEFLAWAHTEYAMPGMRHLAREVRAEVMAQDHSHIALQHYKRTAPTIEQIEARLVPYNRTKVAQVRALIDKVLERQGKARVVDYGCGTGELFTVPLAWHYRQDDRVQITGYDVDPASIMRANAHVSNNALRNLRFIDDVSSLPADSYDVVCNLEVLEHCSEPGKVIEQLAGLAKPGGFVYITVPNGYGPAEIESWFVSKVKGVIYRSTWMLKAALRLKRWLLPPGSLDEKGTAIVAETLHASNNVHVQAFKSRDIIRLATQAKLQQPSSGNSVFLMGIPGMVVDKLWITRKLHAALLNRVPRFMASGWWYKFIRPGPTDNA